jgi:hypothetical protein
MVDGITLDQPVHRPREGGRDRRQDIRDGLLVLAGVVLRISERVEADHALHGCDRGSLHRDRTAHAVAHQSHIPPPELADETGYHLGEVAHAQSARDVADSP